ncbi:hypothetical protein ONE63_009741 [Megalurothrips usitatus]|uniref:C3H1-type domain-containing protein n=1 Tax=Megalurothrips usitatus TaxID=439358 RepID=A0AAV7XFM3_9NEOP|nr:hypothetical protein ONE63_009741 [Megalurothrips usitatus]
MLCVVRVNEMPAENESVHDIGETKVCRDFLRNVCRRGKKRCRYLHPDDDTNGAGATNNTGRTTFLFCHDYQNGQVCKRDDCKFVHCTVEEEQYFKSRGKLPEHVIDSALSKGALEFTPRAGEPPACKDYLKGECRRGVQCKFRHLTKREFERELGYCSQSPPHQPVNEMQPPMQTQLHPQPQIQQPPLQQQAPLQPQLQHQHPSIAMVQFSHGAQLTDGSQDQKRFHYTTTITNQPAPATNIPHPNHRHHPYTRPPNVPETSTETHVPPGMVVLHTHAPPPQASQPSPPYGLHPAVPTAPHHRLLTPAEARSLMLEEENVVLRRRLEELKKQVSDLTVTNEFLLDQNAQLRIGSKRTTTSLAALTVPAVTITNAGPPLPAQITSAQTPAPPQMMVATGTLRTVAASVATVPVSIAAVAGTPVSIATVSMAPVSMQPPIVTMAQQTIGVSAPPTLTAGAPPPQGAQPPNAATACPQSLPLAITAGTTVTYPIPVLQTSLSH